MSQEENVETEVVKTIVEIPLKKILEYSGTKLISGDDAGMLVVQRNVDCMKKWSDDEISKLFKSDGTLNYPRRLLLDNGHRLQRRSFPPNDQAARAQMVKNTRKYVVAALKSIFAEEKLDDPKFKIPGIRKCERMAREFVSEENIKNEFDDSVIVYDQVRKN